MFPITSLSCTEQLTYTNLFTFSQDQGSSSSDMQNVHLLFIIAFVLPLCAIYCILMQLNSQ